MKTPALPVGLQHPSGLEQGEGEIRGVLEDGSDHAVADADGVSFVENEQRVEECRVSAAENVKASEGCEEAQGNDHVYLHKQATGVGRAELRVCKGVADLPPVTAVCALAVRSKVVLRVAGVDR